MSLDFWASSVAASTRGSNYQLRRASRSEGFSLSMTKHSFEDHGDLRKYFAAIPNIVFQLRLNPYELALYAHFKQAAGDDGGACWKSRATIAKEAGMSSGMVTKARQALEMKRPELNNRPLITVTEEPSRTGGKPTCRVTITDIWAVNMSKCSTSPRDIATSHHDGDTRSTSPHDERRHHTSLATSPHVPKEKPMKKNKEEETRGYPFDHFAVIEYCEHFKTELAIFQAETIATTVEDSPVSRAVWSDVLRTFKGNGYQARYAGNALDRYVRTMREIAAGKREAPILTNGSRPRTLAEQFASGELQ